jgi:hypothetical protein
MYFGGAVAMVCVLGAAGEAEQINRIELITDWRFQPDPDHVGVGEDWPSPSFSDAAWACVEAGLRWEDQGFPKVDGYAWYRRHVEIPADWEGRPVWLFLGALNDSGAVYCNGRLINTYGNTKDVETAWVPIVAEMSEAIHFGQSNLIAIEAFGLLHVPPHCLSCTRQHGGTGHFRLDRRAHAWRRSRTRNRI